MSTQMAAYVAEHPGLSVDNSLQRRDWLALAKFITKLEQHTPFYYADLVRIARHSYGWEYEAIRDQFAQMGRDFEFQTLRNYAYVAARFPLAQRCYGPHVRFGHYEAVAVLVPDPGEGYRPLPPAVHDLLLETANKHLTVAEVRRRAALLSKMRPTPSKDSIFWTVKPHRVREFLVPEVDFADLRWGIIHEYVTDDQWASLQKGTIQLSIKVFEITPLEEEQPREQ